MKIAVVIGMLMVAALLLFSVYNSPLSQPGPEHHDTITVTEKSKQIQKPVVNPDPNPFVISFINEYESFIKNALANRQAPGAALAIVKDSSVIFLKGYGLCQFGKPDSINSRTVFRIGSVS